PMNEYADTDEEVIRLIPRNDALCHAVSDRLSDSMLSWAEHLHRLLSVFDRHFIEHYGCRLDHQVRGYHRQWRREAVLVVRQTVGECLLGGAPTRPHDEIDVSDLVAFANERFAST